MIHLLFHFKSFNAAATGSRRKQVTCDHCTTVYHYEIVRKGVGNASSLWGVFPEATQRRAQKLAQRNVSTSGSRPTPELVPCPRCRWVNEALIREFRKSRYRVFRTIAIVVLVLGGALDLILYFGANVFFGRPPSLDAEELWIVASITLVFAGSMLTLQTLRRRGIDPNRTDARGRKNLPIGTPPAILATTDARGRQVFTAVPAEEYHPTDQLWAIFRPGRLYFEPLCCVCLEPPTHTFRIAGITSIPVPLCNACRLQMRRALWVRFLLAVPVILAAGFFASGIIDAIEPAVRYVAMGFADFLLIIFTFMLVARLTRPYRHRVYDRSRGVEAISFRNPAYTALLIRKIGEAEGQFATE